MPNQSTRPYVILLFGVTAISSAAILIRVAQEAAMPSLVIAALRMIVASVILTPLVMMRHQDELHRLTRGEIGLSLLSGLILGVHFAAWITSLEYTSVTASTVLVTTNPLFVAILSWPLLGEKVGRFVLIGIGLAFAGGMLVALSGDAGDPPTRAAPLLGNSLAVIGAIAAANYLIIGRRLRASLSLITYIWLVYGTAAVVLSMVVLIQGAPITHYPLDAYLAVIAMSILAQVIGHSAFNYALGHLPAAYVSLIILGEPIGSTILAMIFLDEYPALLAVIGSAVILTGIAIATRPQKAVVVG